MLEGSFFGDFISSIGAIKFMDIVDILVVAFLFYKVISLVKTSRTSRIAKGVALFLITTWVTSADVLNMYSLNFIMSNILEMGFIVLVIMFQPELRRFLEKLGSKTFKELLVSETGGKSIDQAIGATVSACEIMSKEKTGALIVFERKTLLDEYYKTGTLIDAAVSEQLIRNLFFTNAALHDGAVILRGDRIQAAACVLPLSENTHLSRDLGTRHRAGIGISEVSDAVVVMVSEETGTISVAIGGMLKRHLAAKTLEKLLLRELQIAEENKKPVAFFERAKNKLTKRNEDYEK